MLSHLFKVFELNIDDMFSVRAFNTSAFIPQLDQIRIFIGLSKRFQRWPLYKRIIWPDRLECAIYSLSNLMIYWLLNLRRRWHADGSLDLNLAGVKTLFFKRWKITVTALLDGLDKRMIVQLRYGEVVIVVTKGRSSAVERIGCLWLLGLVSNWLRRLLLE